MATPTSSRTRNRRKASKRPTSSKTRANRSRTSKAQVTRGGPNRSGTQGRARVTRDARRTNTGSARVTGGTRPTPKALPAAGQTSAPKPRPKVQPVKNSKPKTSDNSRNRFSNSFKGKTLRERVTPTRRGALNITGSLADAALRLSQGQSPVQAGVGALSGLAGAKYGAKLGSMVPGPAPLKATTTTLGGIVGYAGLSNVADALLGTNRKPESRPNPGSPSNRRPKSRTAEGARTVKASRREFATPVPGSSQGPSSASSGSRAQNGNTRGSQGRVGPSQKPKVVKPTMPTTAPNESASKSPKPKAESSKRPQFKSKRLTEAMKDKDSLKFKGGATTKKGRAQRKKRRDGYRAGLTYS